MEGVVGASVQLVARDERIALHNLRPRAQLAVLG